VKNAAKGIPIIDPKINGWRAMVDCVMIEPPATVRCSP